MKDIKNIIFDLGGVILDLSVRDTLWAFAQLSGKPMERVHDMFVASPGFEAYEKGLIDDRAFRDHVRELYALEVTDDDIDRCWNAMLRALPITKLRLLTRLKRDYRVCLLSNTNGIHLDYINNVLLPETTGERDLDAYFHRAYYSHRLLLRKPEPEIFLHVANDSDLRPEETIFLDDNLQNVEAATSVGMKGVFVDTDDFVIKYFDEGRG